MTQENKTSESPETPKPEETPPTQTTTTTVPATDAPSPTNQIAEAKNAEGAPHPAAAEKPKGIKPEDYKLQAPKDSNVTEDELKRIAGIASERGLERETAQLLVDERQSAVKEYHNQQVEIMKRQNDTWFEEIKAHPQLGGANFENSMATAQAALKEFFPQEFLDKLVQTNLVHEPDLFQGLYNIGKKLGTGRLVKGESVSSKPQKSVAELFYGNSSEA